MKTKKQDLLNAIKAEDWKFALSIAKSFRRDFTIDEQKILQHGYAFLIGQSANFFEAIQIDMKSEYEKSLEILNEFAGKHDKIEPFYVNNKVFKEKIRKRYLREQGFNVDDEDAPDNKE
ncbi:hypothetical protein [Flavobacterium filum]|uniref:hypothetical protein n=1 Tax=Flavobacterium filum TaxID=370974 RepID=UPI0023F40BB4|nr:hypothetical protein [Flavobacterium filum]